MNFDVCDRTFLAFRQWTRESENIKVKSFMVWLVDFYNYCDYTRIGIDKRQA